MNKIVLKDFSLIIVQTSDKKFLLMNQEGETRVANDVGELVKVIKNLFEE